MQVIKADISQDTSIIHNYTGDYRDRWIEFISELNAKKHDGNTYCIILIDSSDIIGLFLYKNKDTALSKTFEFTIKYTLDRADHRGMIHIYSQEVDDLYYAGNESKEIVLFSFLTDKNRCTFNIEQKSEDIYITEQS